MDVTADGSNYQAFIGEYKALKNVIALSKFVERLHILEILNYDIIISGAI